jgi:agmatine deiminase
VAGEKGEMVADCEANFVCVSGLVAGRFPSVFKALERILSEHGIEFGAVRGTKDIWIRDYAPVQVDRDGSFVLFRYFPDYLRHGYRHLITNAREIISGLPGVRSYEFTEIILDGGNVVRHLGRAIVTDKVYRENPGIGRAELRERLRDLLRVETLIVVPREPFDPFGHADGMVGWLDERSVLINDYSAASESFHRHLNQSLRREQLDLVELPYEPQPGRRDGIPSAAGNWMNFLRDRDLLMVPTFGMKGDERALGILRDVHPGYAVETVDCRRLAEEGGSIHCITWQAHLAE